MTASRQTRERLDQIGEELTALRARRGELREARDIASRHDDTNALSAAETRLAKVEDEIESARALQSTLLHQIAGVSDFNGHLDTFLNNPIAIQQLEQLAYSQMPVGNVALGPAFSRDQVIAMMSTGGWRPSPQAAAGDVTGGEGARRGPHYGIVPQPRRTLRVLDLIPTQPMEGRSFEYTPERGDLDTAREVAEGAGKPPAELDLPDAEVIAQTIAHWVKLKRPQLADVSTLEQTIRTRLMYGVMLRLENQVIAGDGTGDTLRGILNTPGIGEVDFDADTALSDLALDGIVATLLADAEPDAIVINPLDWATMLKARTETGGVRLDSDGAFATPPNQVWGYSGIPSKAMPQGTALAGSFATGATVFVREAVNVRASDSDQDDFTKNKVTLLGEGRFGVAVWQPTAFTVIHFQAASARAARAEAAA